MSDTASLTQALEIKAKSLGFDLFGVCPARTPHDALRRFEGWIADGYAGEMSYLSERADAYADPGRVLANAQTIVMLGMHYRTHEPQPLARGQGRISRYAWSDVDYHDVIHQRLKQLKQFVLAYEPNANVRGVVDSAPLLEREFAEVAGLGWIGKNTLLLNKQSGSLFFLAALLLDLDLAPTDQEVTDHCGSCRACLDACPTNAFPEPYVLDATRCISYLTIELRDHIPVSLRGGIGDWLFGCDICQDVCPWQRHAPLSPLDVFEPRSDQNPIDLLPLFDLDDQQFRERFRKTPLWRSKRRGILRNAAIVLGNRPAEANIPSLTRGLHDEEVMIRSASAWALGCHTFPAAREALLGRQPSEQDEGVRNEIESALSALA